MSKRPLEILSILFLFCFLHPVNLCAGDCQTRSLHRLSINHDYTCIDINTIQMWFSNDGRGSYDLNWSHGGLYWPKGSNKTAVFSDGLIWGGRVDGRLQVNGSVSNPSLQAGPIIGTGANARPDNPLDPRHRIYRIQKNWRSLKTQNQTLYAQFRNDYLQWPGNLGAPSVDKNSNGRWDPPQLDSQDHLVGGDVPSFIGDQQLWFVSNDLNPDLTRLTFNSDPLGLEVQCLVWGYDDSGPLGNAVFKKYTVINKGAKTVDSMYLAYWSDPDLGSAVDDLSGCDTLLNLGFVYNGLDPDAIYGSAPPALGYDFLQGPIVRTSTAADSAMFAFGHRSGYKNLPMTAFMFYLCGGDPVYSEPTSAIQMYRSFHGLSATTGEPISDPTTGQSTRFALAGDPVTGTGWVDGMAPGRCGERYLLMSSGSFKLVPGDTQEIVIGISIAQGNDRLSSVTAMKDNDREMQAFYDHFTPSDDSPPYEIPGGYSLGQNYPNPFNSTTSIEFSLPNAGFVRLSIFDLCGKKVCTVVEDGLPRGTYNVRWKPSNVATGIYFYRLEAGEIVQTRKSTLLK
ncbi:MAG: T9SS type A sorting domain-containing protein [Bacteroidota bacterium]